MDLLAGLHAVQRRLGEVVLRSALRYYAPGDALWTALADMAEHDFSQVIVRTEDGLALVTGEGITRWVAQWAEQGQFTLTGVELRDVHELEHQDNLLVLSTEHTVRDAADEFQTAIREGRPRLFAIVLTATGERTEQPVGIVTPEDLVE